MEYFDVFTDELILTKPALTNLLDKYVKEIPGTPNIANYRSGRKLLAEECLASGNESSCAFHLSEAMSPYIRTLATYRAEQLKAAKDKMHKFKSFVKPVKDLMDLKPLSKENDELFNLLTKNIKDKPKVIDTVQTEEVPFYKRYLNFSSENNEENFLKILKELPKQWTIIQLSALYNPNENIQSMEDYRRNIDAINITLLTNDYLEECELGPITVNVPANFTSEGVKPVFDELYSLLEDNYSTIDNAQFLNNKRRIQRYWSNRDEVDRRMKSVIDMMDRQWLSGWACLLTGGLNNTEVKEKLMCLVDDVIDDWGFIRLMPKQRFLLYNLLECSHVIKSGVITLCIRRILLEHGDPNDFRKVLKPQCEKCTKEFRFLNELCFKCQCYCFEKQHFFKVFEGIHAFSKVINTVKDSEEFACLKNTERNPVILIVDERLDTFPWEMIPVMSGHPVSRMENIHFTYFLYKTHEDNIVDGYVQNTAQVGRYVINPDANLDRMEKRMVSFVKYWCEGWEGQAGAPPSPDQYLQYLTEADIFLYCGHGHGCQLAGGGGGGGGVESAHVRALAVLAGCGSARLGGPAPRAPPTAPHHHLHLAACPMVVGMLWEVTDLEVDKMVSTLLSLVLPSSAPKPWAHVGKEGWSQGNLDAPRGSAAPERAPGRTPERTPDVLRAVSRSRGASSYTTIAASATARGIPVIIRQDLHTGNTQ